jgi:hypothetical protein
MLRAVDNKDRWIASVDADGDAGLQPRHRLTDPGWINWGFNDFGWMPTAARCGCCPRKRLLAPVHRRHRRQGEAAQRQRLGTSRRCCRRWQGLLFLCNRERPSATKSAARPGTARCAS